jgi:hypothetical protein
MCRVAGKPVETGSMTGWKEAGWIFSYNDLLTKITLTNPPSPAILPVTEVDFYGAEP